MVTSEYEIATDESGQRVTQTITVTLMLNINAVSGITTREERTAH